MNILIAHYQPVSGYPPVINAITTLLAQKMRVIVVSRHFADQEWTFNGDFVLEKSGPLMYLNDMYRISGIEKLRTFLDFGFKILKNFICHRPEIVLMYDPFSLFWIQIIQLTGIKSIFWYHSHDVYELEGIRGSFLTRFCCRVEPNLFSKIDYFSCPVTERLKYYPIHLLKTDPFIIPNYPHTHLFTNFRSGRETGQIRLIYQGRIAAGHGLLEILDWFPMEVNGEPVTMTLFGNMDEDFKGTLDSMLSEKKITHLVHFEGALPYRALIQKTPYFDIGLAIHLPDSIMYATGATASNKIYEYMACGLPVLFYETDHYRHYLSKYEWCFFTDLTPHSFKQELEKIIQHYDAKSLAARQDFENRLNFEQVFNPVLESMVTR